MLMKREIVRLLDQYEDLEHPLVGGTNRETGIMRELFIIHVLEQKSGNKAYTEKNIDKCIDDCIEDGWIGTKTEPVIIHGLDPIITIFVKSRGREIINLWFFIPTVVEKFSAKEILLFAFSTGVMLLLGYFGIKQL